jgi:periplasmic protein TonB
VTREAIRWVVCAIIVVAAHAFAWLTLSTQEFATESDAGSPIVTLELSPLIAAPASPPEEATRPAQPNDTLNAPSPRVDAAAPIKIEPPANATDPSPGDSDGRPAEPPPPPSPERPPDAKTSPLQEEDVMARSPTAPRPRPPAAPPISPPVAPSAPMPSVVDIPAAPEIAPGSEEVTPPAAVQRWRQALIAQIERHKRFPVHAKGQSGIVKVAFNIDRGGRVLEVRVLASSGSAALDESALDLIRQAQPFPTPPVTLPDRDLSFVAPIRYLRSNPY